MYIALSPTYTVRNEAHASFLIRVVKIIEPDIREFGTFCIPPFMGYILSHIGDHKYPEAISAISRSLGLSSAAIDRFVQQIVENSESKEFKFSENISVVLPRQLLRRYEEKPENTAYDEDGFDGHGDFEIRRPQVPIYANLMVTTSCTTDCLYCYADRSLRPSLKTEKLLDLIRELHDQGTVNLALTGGDIFAHPDWRRILKCARQYGFEPFLSTKTPLDAEQICYLRDLGYKEIQFSLDSVYPEILGRLVKVDKRYLDMVSSFLRHCSEQKLDVLVRSVLTKINASRDMISSLYTYLKGFGCVKEWVMTPAFFSVYRKSEYSSLKVSNEDLSWVYDFSRSDDTAFPIGLNKIGKDGYVLKRHQDTEDFVCHNQICLANTSCISILANGDCNVCEMLYENPDFLLGNINESTIRDIWNSDKALHLYTMVQQQFPKSSPCSSCGVFEKCRNAYGKRVCYVDIVKSGHSKWDPDPRCPLAEDTDMVL